MYLREIFEDPQQQQAPQQQQQQQQQAPQQQGEEGSTNFKQGDKIGYTNVNARPPKTYTGTIQQIKMYDGEQWASVQWDQDANGNYNGPGQQEWQQISKGNMINLHWAKKIQQERPQQAPQQQQQSPQQSQHTPTQRPPQAQQIPTQQ